MNSDYRITTEDDLEALLGAPMDFVRAKILRRLDGFMLDFIRHSPLAFISTLDEHGHVDVSPKGDPAGFIHVDAHGHLLVPERLGNKLAFGLRNVLRNGRIGLIFLVPHQRETLRVKGSATLHADPEVLAELSAHGRPALLYTRVVVEECFFHCGKALIRSGLWNSEAWGEAAPSIAARQFASLRGAADEAAVKQTEGKLEDSYRSELY